MADKDAYRWENDCWRFKNENLRCFGNTLGAIFASGHLGEVSALKAGLTFTRTNSFASGVGIVQEIHAVDPTADQKH